MGGGIAFVTAVKAQLPVRLYDSSKHQLDRQLKFLDTLLEKSVQKGKLTQEERIEARARIQPVTELSQLFPQSGSQCDCVIEAVSENLTVKKDLFAQLAKMAPQDCVLASNTSSISITKLAAATCLSGQQRESARRVIGMHFMNPVPVMRLIEIIPGLETSPTVTDRIRKLSAQMGKQTTLSNDVPGFIANRLLMPYINEAFYALQEHLGTQEDIDLTMRLGTNMPMGPLELADFIGLDTCLAIMRVLHSQLGDDKYRPCPLLVKYVDANRLGKKNGFGIYTYSK